MLSKSQYTRGLQCHKSLWLYKNRKELISGTDAKKQAIFDMGNLVGDYATNIFPGGVEIEFNPKDFDGMAKQTWELIKSGVETIYEATFIEKGVFAMADILQRGEDGWELYEAKASTKVKPYYIDDASVQWYALSNVLELKKASIVHINNQYVRGEELEASKLFSINDITDEVIANQASVQANLANMERMIKGDVPGISIGPQCTDPHECDFIGHCWSHIPEKSIFNLYRMQGKKKHSLYKQGIVSFEDLPADFKLSDKQQIQLVSTLNNETFIDRSVISDFLNQLEYPISFLDFESFQDAIPRFEGQRPFMQMPFQYSLHIVDEDGHMVHKEFLGDERTDPRRVLSEQMLHDLPQVGPIVAFNMGFEKGIVKELASMYPDLEDGLMDIHERFVDLLAPFHQSGYYHPAFNGSFSIKSVLPALFPDAPELDYKGLNIQDGGAAMNTFAKLHLNDDPEEVKAIREDLLAYCHLDTLAMVKIWEHLKSIVGHKA